MGDPVALESRPLGRTIGAHCPRTEARVLYLVRRRLIKWRYFWPAVSRVSRAVLSPAPTYGCACILRDGASNRRHTPESPGEDAEGGSCRGGALSQEPGVAEFTHTR